MEGDRRWRAGKGGRRDRENGDRKGRHDSEGKRVS